MYSKKVFLVFVPGLSFRGPRVQLREVVNDDGDKGKIEVSDPASNVALHKSGVKVMRGQQISNHVDGFMMDFRFSEKNST